MKSLLIVIIFVSILNGQYFSQFSEALDGSLGDANLASTSPTLLNPASFFGTNQTIARTSFYYLSTKHEQLDNSFEIYDDIKYYGFTSVLKYRNYGFFYKYYANEVAETINILHGNFRGGMGNYYSIHNTIGIIFSYNLTKKITLGIAPTLYIFDNPHENSHNKTMDFTVGINYTPFSALRFGIVINNILKSDIEYYSTNIFISQNLSELQRSIDMGFSIYPVERISLFSSLKNIFKESIKHYTSEYDYRSENTNLSYHVGISFRIIESLFLDAGYKLVTGTLTPVDLKRYQFKNLGFSYKLSDLFITVMYGWNNIGSENSSEFRSNNLFHIINESSNGQFKFSASYLF
jgi:hypothetical protein